MQANRKRHILLACTGSVATVKIPEIVCRLTKFAEVLRHRNKIIPYFICTRRISFIGISIITSQVRLITTSHGYDMLFGGVAEAYNKDYYLQFVSLDVQLYRDEDEWKTYTNVHVDPVLHIEVSNYDPLLRSLLTS